MTQLKDIKNSPFQLQQQTSEMTTNGSSCMLISSMCFKSACRESVLGSTRCNICFLSSDISHQVFACTTTHIFSVTNVSVSFMNPAFSTGISSQHRSFEISQFSCVVSHVQSFPPPFLACRTILIEFFSWCAF